MKKIKYSNSSTELIYGINPVRELLIAGRRKVYQLLIVSKEKQRLEEIIKLASLRKIQIRWIDGKEMSSLFSSREDQGVAAKAEPYPYYELEEILKKPDDSKNSVIIALDQIQDPRNLGAIARSAVAFFCDAMVIHKNRCSPVTPVAMKASAGMTEHLKIAMVSNLAFALRKVKDEGYTLYGLDANATKSIFETQFGPRAVFVMGHEGSGLRELTSKLCDELIRIPISPLCNSLNVSVAAGVVLGEALRQSGRCRT